MKFALWWRIISNLRFENGVISYGSQAKQFQEMASR